MRGIMIRFWLLPLLLAGGLAACDSGAVNPGYVNTAAAPAGGSANAVTVGSGRVVEVNEVALRGSGGGGSGRGPLIGGLLGGLGGAAIGASTSQSVGGGLVGGLLGAIGGAIAGSIFESNGGAMSGGRGIAITVQRDDGQRVTIAQRDDGDIQLGDRVQIVQDQRGVARVVRDTSHSYDRTASAPPPSNGSQYGGQQNNGPPPQYNGASAQNYPQPQNDPRYGKLN